MIKHGLIFLVLATTNVTAEPGLEDYAQGIRLVLQDETAIYRVSLPGIVYQTSVRRDLGDIRVFNGNGEAVPHTLRNPERQEQTESISRSIPFFPLPGDEVNGPIGSSFNILLNERGNIIYIQSKEGDPGTGRNVSSWILDLSDNDIPVNELVFEVTGEESEFVKQASLESSDDLDSWSTLIASFNLIELHYNEFSLTRNSIELPDREFKYLRLKWLNGDGKTGLTGITANTYNRRTEPQREYEDIKHASFDNENNAYYFDVSGNYPVNYLNVVLPDSNSLIETSISTRENRDGQWIKRYSGLFYNLQVQGVALTNDPVILPNIISRHWELQISNSNGLGQNPPVLNIGWVPAQLYFLARGDGPFTLAFGNVDAEPVDRPFDALMNVLDADQSSIMVREARPGESITLRGASALEPDLSLPWGRIGLWAILVFGVAIIGTMTIRLYRQMNV